MSDIEEPTVEETSVEVEVEVEVEEEAEFVGEDNSADIKLFGKWSFEEIEVRDISLEVCFLPIMSCT
jgi:small subunit ribosomal protein S5e